MPHSPLTEHIVDWHTAIEVDAAHRIVRNVALAGTESRNGYTYHADALAAAAHLYDRKPVFLDHAANRLMPHDRSTRDLVGSITNPRFEGGRIRGDIRVLDTDSGRTFLALVDSDTPGIGMSHVVLAQRSLDGSNVESIADVLSVDAVVAPATTSTFRESTTTSTPVVVTPSCQGDARAVTAECRDRAAINDAVPAHSPRVGQETAQSPAADTIPAVPLLEQSLASLTAECDQLRTQITEMQARREQEVRAQRMDALLTSSGLPAFAATPLFRSLLNQAPDDDARQALISERLQLISTSRQTPPNSQSRLSDHSATSTTQAFLKALKR
ncbi:MAG: hypothetical protein R3B90_05560 [Planctomycetaceae bacterium]